MNLLKRILSVREAATVPSMDGVLRPNSLLDQATSLATVREPDNLVGLGGDLLFSSGRDILRLDAGRRDKAPPELFLTLEAPVTALTVCASGTLAAGLDEIGIRLVGGAHDGVVLSGLGGMPVKGPTALTFVDEDTLLACIGSVQQGPEDWQRDLMEAHATGSVWKIGIRSKTATCLADGLAFPNGLILHRNRLVVSESWKHRLVGLNLSKKARPETLLEDLPGYPGRLSAGRDSTVWLAVFAPRSQLIEFTLRERAYCHRMLREIPREFWIAPTLRSGRSFREPMQGGAVRVHGIFKPWAPTRSYGLAVQLDGNFQPIASFHSRADGNRHGIVSLCEWGDVITFASRGDDVVGALNLDFSGNTDAAR